MKEKDFVEALEWLDNADGREWMIERLIAVLEGLEDDINDDLTPDQEKTLKSRLIEVRDYMMADEWDLLKHYRKGMKYPRSRFWWYMDELKQEKK